MARKAERLPLLIVVSLAVRRAQLTVTLPTVLMKPKTLTGGDGANLKRSELVERYAALVEGNPPVMIEDGAAGDDRECWGTMLAAIAVARAGG